MLDNYTILDWDSSFFGYKVAKLNINTEDYKSIERCLKDVIQLGAKLVYCQAENGSKVAANLASKYNGHLVDIKTTYRYTLNSEQKRYKNESFIKYKSDPLSDDILLKLAVQCGIYSRFFVDPRIKVEKAKDLYQTWIRKSISKELADDILIYNFEKRIIGLISVYLKGDIGNIGLLGVDENFRGKGIGKNLVDWAISYFSSKNAKFIDVVTQGKNLSACKLYEKCGFKLEQQFDFYHFWNE